MYLNDKLKEIVGEPGLRPLVVKADPFSLDSLIAWLETKPGGEAYNMDSITDCLICQFASARAGRQLMFGEAWAACGYRTDICQIAYADQTIRSQHTFSSALSRARALRDTP